ncbi:MAG: rhodanese-like domain-containing protein [Pseudomonadota bacterium]
MVDFVSSEIVRTWLSDGEELAFLDVREYGEYGESHPLFVIPVAYSTFESRLVRIAPNRQVRMVLVDGDDGIAEKAAARAEALGYGSVHILKGGAKAWGDAGFTLYAGVNVPSKTFGELLEIERHTPRLSAEDVRRMQEEKTDHVIVDGRPYAEYNNFSIPGGVCCPNGELALRIRDLAPSPDTTIVVNCAGRTRSILGAQTLIDAGVTNPIYALENGTQGWFLVDLPLDHGATRKYPEESGNIEIDDRRTVARKRAESAGVEFISADVANASLSDQTRTHYVIDVRTAEEFASDGIAGSIHAPGGQLVQATDEWIGVREANILLLDSDGVRAPLSAYWLRQMGHRASVLEGGIEAAKALNVPTANLSDGIQNLPLCDPATLDTSTAQLIDLRSSLAFRDGHIDGAVWGIRPRLPRLNLDTSRAIVLIGDEITTSLASEDLKQAGASDVSRLSGTSGDWERAGLTVVTTPNSPSDAERIDHLFFTAERRHNKDASRQYLKWEVDLVDQLDEQERAIFQLVAD